MTDITSPRSVAGPQVTGYLRPFVLVLAATFAAMVGVASCTSTSSVSVGHNRSGSVEFAIELDAYFVETLDDFAMFLDEPATVDSDQVFDIETMRADLNDQPFLAVRSLSSPVKTELTGVIDITDIEAAFRGDADIVNTGIIRYAKTANTTRIDIEIDRTTFAQLVEVIPALQNELLDLFGPLANERISEAEYLELMSFAFGDEIQESISNGLAVIELVISGTLVSQTGGTVRASADGTTRVVFEIPLIRLLLLDRPLRYQIVFT